MKKLSTVLLAMLAPLLAWAQNGNEPEYVFKGTLNGKIAVELTLESGKNNVVAGYIYYPRAKNPAPILVVGELRWEDPYNMVYIKEYQPDGTISGRMYMKFSEVEGDYEFVEGTWTNPKTEAELPMRLRSVFQKPSWYVETPLKPEDPGNIGREYGYTFWNNNYKSMMGGNVTFKAAGKNKVHFEVSNCPQNIAEGGSEPGRPAVLNGNEFEYREVNECHYGFRATFYKRFVVLETIAGTDQLSNCFGMGVAFDGVYIRY